ncbi:ROK family protein, partial [Treponema sp. OttesenSCG-928-L16]|nr:ROK family protein [Treponema sp. OttesenSCG-928-L16]
TLNLDDGSKADLIDSLIGKKLILEKNGDAQDSGVTGLFMNEQFGCILGLEIQPAGYHCVILTITGKMIFSSAGFLPELPFNEIVDDILYGLYPEIKRLGLPLLGVCLGMPGIIDSRKGVIIESHPFSLFDYKIVQTFSQRYGVPFFVENDANCLVWLELAEDREGIFKDFFCINAECNQAVHSFGEWAPMGIGMGIAADGGLYRGGRNAAGELVTISWKGAKIGQTGLKAPEVASIKGDTEAFAGWVKDIFASLTPIVSVLNPQAVFVYGELFRRSAKVDAILDEQVPQFREILRQTSCEYVYRSGSGLSVAAGAAMMFLVQLYSVPELKDIRCDHSVAWDTLFALASPETNA